MSRYVTVRLTEKEAEAILGMAAWVEWDAGTREDRARERALEKVREALRA